MSTEVVDIQTSLGTFEVPVEVRWGDMDALRHVNNTAYFRYFEEARVRLLSSIAMGADRAWSGVLAHASCDFLKPLLYPARIVVGLGLRRIGRTSIELDCWIAAADDPRDVYAKGRNVLVCIDRETGQAAPWSDADRQMLSRCFSA